MTHIDLAAADPITMTLISVGMSILAGLLLKKSIKSPIQDDKPTTLTTRGSYFTWFVGLRRVGPVFACAPLADREIREESVPGGKGFGGPTQDVYYEVGWHQLAVGPCDALHEIVQQGRVIFKGPITRTSHPSGSTVDLGSEGSFTIYWGEPDQPVNTFLGVAHRVGISSRWPHCCYVVWNKKRLGSSPNWPILNYTLERRPTTAVLTGSDGWYEPTATLDGPTAGIVAVNANANPDVGYLEVTGDLTAPFDPGRQVRISGNALSTGDYIVRRATLTQVVIGMTPNGYPIYQARTRVFLETGTAGADANGTIQAYSFANDDGANIAHCLSELLFADWPLGLELDTDPNASEPWDLPSLEALGAEAETDGQRSSLVGVDGEEADAILAAALQDHGSMLPIDTANGRMLFQLVREPSGTLPNITGDIVGDELPEIETFHGERPVDVLVFEFADRDQQFSNMTIAVKEDGQISYLEHQRARRVPIASTTHFATAGQLAERRSQEELAGGGEFRLVANRGARELIPGQAVVADDFDEVLRVVGVTVDPLSEQVLLRLAPDFYGARKSDFVNEPGGGAPDVLDPAVDLQFKWFEVPEQLLGTEEMFVQVARIRANAQVSSAAIHFSRDNSTYTQVGSESGVATGGTLDVELAASSRYFLTQGPTFQLLGPDASSALDLSADPVNFGLGRQLCVIASSAGIEVCFVQKITAVSGSQYRLDGLLRARYDTRRLTHPVGAEVYVFQNDALESFQDVLLEPDEDLYVKSQPSTSGGSVPLGAVTPYGELLYGKGLVPITPERLRVTAPYLGASVYFTGDDVTVAWSWSSAASSNTGAGFQSAGTPIGAPVIKGAFVVELLTTGDVLVQTDTVTVPEITYPNAVLAASPISHGSFKVRVRQEYNGYASDTTEFTVIKL